MVPQYSIYVRYNLNRAVESAYSSSFAVRENATAESGEERAEPDAGVTNKI